MKKFLSVFILLLALVCALGACDEETPEHTHAYGEWKVTTAATCSMKGEEKRICACGESETREIPQLAHSFGEWSVTNAAACSAKGEEERVCACGAREMREIPATGAHIYGNWSVIKGATCSVKGEEKRTCMCGAFETKEIAAGHLLTHHPAKAASCAAGNKEFWFCNACLKYFNDATGKSEIADIKSIVIAASAEHAYGADNRCTECQHALTYTKSLEYVLNADGESYTVYDGRNISVCDVVIPPYHEGKPVTNIGKYAFSRHNLLSVVIPAGVTSIDELAFYYCDALARVEIATGVTSIGARAFFGCDALTHITIPASVVSIGKGVLDGCTAMESITVESGNTVYHSAGNCLIETESRTLIAGCKSSVIPADGSVVSIGDSAFSGCAALTSLAIPAGVTSIGDNAFANCHKLVSIEFPADITSIGEDAFFWCTSLANIELPASVTSIGSSAFYYCTSLANIEIPVGVVSIGKYAFSNCTKLTNVEIPAGVTSIAENPFYGCSLLESITVASNNAAYYSAGNCLIEKGSGTLIAGCKNSVIPADGSILRIGNAAFAECISLKNIDIPASVTYIDDYAFFGCYELTAIEIPTHVTGIGNYAFYDCPSLTSVEMPASLMSIGIGAFEGAVSLTSVVFAEGGTEGWWCAKDAQATSGREIPADKLADPAKAAEYLKWYYSEYYWKRTVE